MKLKRCAWKLSVLPGSLSSRFSPQASASLHPLGTWNSWQSLLIELHKSSRLAKLCLKGGKPKWLFWWFDACVGIVKELCPRTHGWRKFWNIHALRTETDLSGNPLCGLHNWLSFLFSCWSAHCFWMKDASKDFSSFLPTPWLEYAPIAMRWLLILSLRFLYNNEIVCRTKRACMGGSNSVTAWNADTTVWISSRHSLYRSST